MLKIKKPTKKTILLIVLILMIGAAAGVFYLNKKSEKDQSSKDSNIASDYINYNPPTKEDKKRAEENKDRVVARDEQEKNQPNASSANKKEVKPVITYAGVYGQDIEVGGFVNGIFEDGGTCTATFTKDSVKVTKTVLAVKNANSVDCPVMGAKTSEFSSKGMWQVTITYDSATASGSSDSKPVEIK